MLGRLVSHIAQVPLGWAFDDPEHKLSQASLNRITLNLTPDTGQGQRAISNLTSGCTTTPPYKHTDNVYFSGMVYVDAAGKKHTGWRRLERPRRGQRPARR